MAQNSLATTLPGMRLITSLLLSYKSFSIKEETEAVPPLNVNLREQGSLNRHLLPSRGSMTIWSLISAVTHYFILVSFHWSGGLFYKAWR